MPASKLYRYIMETPPPEDAAMMRLYPQAPHPYVIAAPVRERDTHLKRGERFSLPLKLFGRANDLLAAVLLAFGRAAARGLGPHRGRARLIHATQRSQPDAEPVRIFEAGRSFTPQPPWRPDVLAQEPPSEIVLRLHSPLRLAVKGRVLTPDRFTSPYPLLMNIIRRISALCAFHGDAPLQADYRALKQQAEMAQLIDSALVWRDQKRFSARTRKTMPLGGVLGTLRLDLANAPALWPFLWLGQWVHAGKGTVFGLGGYRLEHPV
jgi:hypothetical protein